MTAIALRDALPIAHGYAVARRAGMTHAGAVLATAQGWMESHLGYRGQFLLPGGVPSYNWGATTARKGVRWFGGGDRDASGNPIAQRWAGPWPSLDAGFAYWASFGSVRYAWAAYNRGDEAEVARILYRGGYYTGVSGTDEERIAAYASWLRQGRRQVEAALSGSFGRAALGVALVGAVAALAVYGPRAIRR